MWFPYGLSNSFFEWNSAFLSKTNSSSPYRFAFLSSSFLHIFSPACLFNKNTPWEVFLLNVFSDSFFPIVHIYLSRQWSGFAGFFGHPKSTLFIWSNSFCLVHIFKLTVFILLDYSRATDVGIGYYSPSLLSPHLAFG